MTQEPIWKQAWRPAAAAAFIVIVLFDFLIMPTVMQSTHSPVEIAELAQKFDDPAVQIQLLKSIENQGWQPLTLQQNGMFFVAFGAILGFAAFGRSQEKRAAIEKS